MFSFNGETRNLLQPSLNAKCLILLKGFRTEYNLNEFQSRGVGKGSDGTRPWENQKNALA